MVDLFFYQFFFDQFIVSKIWDESGMNNQKVKGHWNIETLLGFKVICRAGLAVLHGRCDDQTWRTLI